MMKAIAEINPRPPPPKKGKKELKSAQNRGLETGEQITK